MAKNLLKIAAPKKRRAITPRGLDAKYLGDEPSWDGQEFLNEDELNSKIAAAYNWYNYFLDHKSAREYLMAYMAESGMSKAAMSMVGKNVDWKLNLTMCKNARMLSMGLDSEKIRTSLDEHLVKLVESGIAISKEEKNAAASKPQYEKNPASILIADIEEMIDHDPDEEWSTNFYSWLKDTKQVKPAQAKAIADYYRPTLTELQEAEKTKDPDLKYAYRHFTKKKFKERIALFSGIISDCESIITNKRKSVVRKPRKTKPKSADKVVSKIKYQKEDTNLKIASIDPAKIVGAKELWVFNTKYNVLAHYWSEQGLSVKGTTLQGVDAGRSKQKKLRKPADVLPGITSSTSKAAERAFEAVKTKEATPNGRINEFTVILRAIK
jgi:hypothetical protein